MRFFTPELYLSFNSSDDDEADRANTRWEDTIQEYQRHLDSFRLDMPYQLRSLSDLSLHDAEILCLYDAETLGIKQEAMVKPHSSIFPTVPPSFVLTLRQHKNAILLIYSLWDRVRLSPPSPAWRFSKSHIHWLYDEIDRVNGHQGCFWHRILMSDGAVVEIPVHDVLALQLREFPVAGR